MVRPRLFVLLVFVAVALVSCGGGSDSGDAEELLDRAFSNSIESADLKVDAELQLKGGGALDGPVRIQASGPFRTNKGKLPSADIELRIGSGGGGQTVQTGFLSTGDRAFVKFEDVYYEQPASQVKDANESIRKTTGKRRGSLKSLGLDPRTWLSEAQQKDDETIAGVDTRHVSGTLDVEKVMSNINRFVQRSSKAIGGATGQNPPKPLSAEDIRKISEVVDDPTFDVYVGKEDDTIRRVSGRVKFEVPEDSRDSLGGIEGGSLEFSVEFSDVNGDQQIEAPTNAQPLSKLTQALGQTGVLGGGTQSQTDDGQSSAPPLGTGDGTSTAPGSGDSPGAEEFQRYADCLDNARPEDTEALQRCANLLQP
ncbi:MAG: hypothetical protein H0U84_01295 [Thermoleophilaceae bacterium]|nr:hypothetical protein [Thermoleophilaceae bacterium]